MTEPTKLPSDEQVARLAEHIVAEDARTATMDLPELIEEARKFSVLGVAGDLQSLASIAARRILRLCDLAEVLAKFAAQTNDEKSLLMREATIQSEDEAPESFKEAVEERTRKWYGDPDWELEASAFRKGATWAYDYLEAQARDGEPTVQAQPQDDCPNCKTSDTWQRQCYQCGHTEAMPTTQPNGEPRRQYINDWIIVLGKKPSFLGPIDFEGSTTLIAPNSLKAKIIRWITHASLFGTPIERHTEHSNIVTSADGKRILTEPTEAALADRT